MVFEIEAKQNITSQSHTSEYFPVQRVVNIDDLGLIPHKMSLRICEYKIMNNPHKMLQVDTLEISNLGMRFISPIRYPVGCLMRILVDMPDFWVRKSRYVLYRYTSAPTYFQVLGRILKTQEVRKKSGEWDTIVEIVSIDKIDEIVLCEYLGLPIPSLSSDKMCGE